MKPESPGQVTECSQKLWGAGKPVQAALAVVLLPRLQQGGDGDHSHEAWPLGKLLRPSVTLWASPVHTSSVLARPSGKQR